MRAYCESILKTWHALETSLTGDVHDWKEQWYGPLILIYNQTKVLNWPSEEVRIDQMDLIHQKVLTTDLQQSTIQTCTERAFTFEMYIL